jgi:hypothetical protein
MNANNKKTEPKFRFYMLLLLCYLNNCCGDLILFLF